MTAEPPQSPLAEAVRSLELRWIFPGPLETAVAGWFGRFPTRTEAREDAYLLNPQLPGLSVKVRGDGALEVKAYRGSPGTLSVPSRRTDAWSSGRSGPFRSIRSAPTAATRPAGGWSARDGASAGSHRPADRPRLAPPGLSGQPRCEVELTEVHTSGQDWWTLGFEATGPAEMLRSELQATAALVFAQALPGAAEPGPDESRSYAEWLSQRPGADNDTSA